MALAAGRARSGIRGLTALVPDTALLERDGAAPQTVPAAGLAVAPMLPAALLAAFRRPSSVFWAGVASLLYFCHGVMLAWSAPEVRMLALAETLLSAVLVLSASWDGMRARFAARRAGKPAV